MAWASRNSLAITHRTDLLVYSQADIGRLDIATGSRRNVLQGLGLEYLGAGAVLLGSRAIGGITGALIKRPRWTRVRPAGLGVSISF